MISLVTTCGNRFEYLSRTLHSMAEAAEIAVEAVEVVCVDFGPTPGVKALCGHYQPVKRMSVHAEQWNFGKARNAGLKAASGEIFINVDCDTYIDAESLDWVAMWMKKQGSRSYIRSQCRRGVHGRFAFFTQELRDLGGFHEADIDGAEHLMGADIEDLYQRAELAGFNSARWPKRFEVIDHEIDRPAACRAGNLIRKKMQARD